LAKLVAKGLVRDFSSCSRKRVSGVWQIVCDRGEHLGSFLDVRECAPYDVEGGCRMTHLDGPSGNGG
jgi:hypothetical protein